MKWIELWQAAPANDNAGTVRGPRVRSVFIVTPAPRSLDVIAGRAVPANDTAQTRDGDNPEVAK